MNFDNVTNAIDRSRRSTVCILIESDDEEQPFFIGSGVLVRLAHKEFVLTAGHNVWSKRNGRLAQIAVCRTPDAVSVVVRPGDGSAGRIHVPSCSMGSDPEPDVAVIETTPKTPLFSGRQPFDEDDVRYFDGDAIVKISPTEATGRTVVASGFGVHFAKYQHGPIAPGDPTHGFLESPAISSRFATIPRGYRAHFPAEPTEGRGIHIHFTRTIEDADGAREVVRMTSGFSGGPIVSPDCYLVGLVRGSIELQGKWDGWDQWCEPAVEAVRLLLVHEDVAVRASAERVVTRYDLARHSRTN